MSDYVYPPDSEKARKHRMANRIFKGVDESCQQECECCHRKIGTEQVQTSCNIETNQLSFLGPGVPLYFMYLRHVILILLIMSIVFMGFSIYSNVTSSDCLLISECIPNAFNIMALVNKQYQISFLSVQSYLSLAFVVFIILIFHYFRYHARKLKAECDEVMDTPSDYAIILRRLPPNTTEKDIMDLIDSRKQTLSEQQLKSTQNLKVCKVIMSYNLREYEQKKAQNLEQFKKCVKQDRIDEFTPKDLPQMTKTSSIAIVIFENQITKSYFIHKPTMIQKAGQFFCTPCLPLSDFTINNSKISIQRAPQPDDICWMNSGITMYGAICRKIVYGILDILILLVGGGVLYGLGLLSKSTSDVNVQAIITNASSVFVIIFNSIILVILVLTTEKERCETMTEFQNTLMVKITMFMFLNAGIFVVIVEIGVNYTTFQLSHDLCSQITLIMILNAITPNISLLILSYFQVINRLLRFVAERGWITVTQLQLNEMYEMPQIDTPYRYAHILKTLLLTALYAPVTPIVVFVSMVGLIINYFIEKFLYTRSYSLPNTVSSIVFENAVQLLQYFLIAFAFGQLVVYFYFYKFSIGDLPFNWTICIFLTISLAVLNMYLPMQVINEYLFPIQQSSNSAVKYSQIQEKIEVTYEMLNPAYKTTRKRQNIKDFMGINLALGYKSKRAQAELANIFDFAVAKNMGAMNKQPLLSDVVGGTNSQNTNKQGLLSLGTTNPNIDSHKLSQQGNPAQTLKNSTLQPPAKTPNKQQILTPSRKQQGKVSTDNQVNTRPKVQKVMTIGEAEVARQQQQAAQFSQQKLKKGEKFSHSFSVWKRQQPQNQAQQNERFEEKPSFNYQPMSPRQKLRGETHTKQATQTGDEKELKSGSVRYDEIGLQQNTQPGQTSAAKPKSRVRGFYGWKTDKKQKTQLKQSQLSKRFRYLQIKTKGSQKASKQGTNLDATNDLLPPVTAQQPSARSFIVDPSQFRKDKDEHVLIEQNYQETFEKHSEFKNSKASLGSAHEDNEGRKNRVPLYDDPIKEKKATYDPLHLKESYKGFFKQRNQDQTGTSFLSRTNVRNYVGNSFSKLLMSEEREQSSLSTNIPNNTSASKN